jgi:NAD(P)-dependent dehydrogenase (short-subunit alcohol dehydrogenase family)
VRRVLCCLIIGTRGALLQVSLPEAVEVQAINVLAPFILNSKLKPLLLKSGRDTYIVNVSAMEGQFYRCVDKQND